MEYFLINVASGGKCKSMRRLSKEELTKRLDAIMVPFPESVGEDIFVAGGVVSEGVTAIGEDVGDNIDTALFCCAYYYNYIKDNEYNKKYKEDIWNQESYQKIKEVIFDIKIPK